MESLYRIKEYSGELPNPRHFPIRGANIIAIREKPYAFSDGFILDLSVREADKKVLEGKVSRTVDISYIDTFLKEALISELLLSEPEFIHDIYSPAYIVFTPKDNPIAIQAKYYQYFRNRYPKCKFYVRDDEPTTMIAIKVGEEVVGFCMPMFFQKETLNRIKEERSNKEAG